MKPTALPCSHPPCRRQVTDPSGRCFAHRGVLSGKPVGDAPAPPPPSILATEPGADLGNGFYLEAVVGGVRIERWKETKGVYRTDGPAEIRRRPDGSIETERWCTGSNGHPHREDGPATIDYYPDGSVKSEVYFIDWKLSRLDGPARIEYSPNGKTKEYYAFHSRGIAAEKFGKVISTYPAEVLAEEVERAPGFRPLRESGVSTDRIVEIMKSGVVSPEGIREVLDGAPPEWVRAYEESRR